MRNTGRVPEGRERKIEGGARKTRRRRRRWTCEPVGMLDVRRASRRIRRRFSASRSISAAFSRKPSRWMEGHDLGGPEDWYPAVAARSRRCLVSTSIAKQPEREIRPAISRSPSLPPFPHSSPAGFVSSLFPAFLPFFLPFRLPHPSSLSLCRPLSLSLFSLFSLSLPLLLFNFHWKPPTTAIILAEKTPCARRKSRFGVQSPPGENGAYGSARRWG